MCETICITIHFKQGIDHNENSSKGSLHKAVLLFPYNPMPMILWSVSFYFFNVYCSAQMHYTSTLPHVSCNPGNSSGYSASNDVKVGEGPMAVLTMEVERKLPFSTDLPVTSLACSGLRKLWTKNCKPCKYVCLFLLQIIYSPHYTCLLANVLLDSW